MVWKYIKIIEEWLTDYSEIPVLIVSSITGIYFSVFSSIFYDLIRDISKADITKATSSVFNIEIAIGGIILIVLSLAIVWLSYKHKKRLKDVIKENQDLKDQVDGLTGEDELHQDTIKEIVEFLNRYIGDCILDFGGATHKTDRISLYVFDEAGFFPIARYSANPIYNAVRRHQYPPDQGAISHAWNDGEYFKIYPDPIRALEEYYTALETLEHIPREVAELFSMKPPLIYGYRIGENHHPKAIFIVESTKNTRFTKRELEGLFRDSEQINICKEIILRLELPNPYLGENWESEEENLEQDV